MSDKPSGRAKRRKGRIDILDFLIVAVLLLLVLAIFVGVLAISFPGVAKQTIDNVLMPGGGAGKAISKVANRATEGYIYRVRPLMSAIGRFFRWDEPPKPGKAEPVIADIDASSCYKCHPDVFTQDAVNHIYVRHREHEAAGVVCGVCHKSDKHDPKPAVVREETCIECHKRVLARVDCPSCHKAASLLDDRLIAREKRERFLAGRAVAGKVLVPSGFEHPVDYQNTACKQCHDVPEFCTRCHVGMHDGILSGPHDERWIPTHGPRILKGDLATTGCWQCHKSSLFCASACHPNPGRQRISPNAPLPKLDLR